MTKLVVLDGGSRHGESTTVDEHVQRLLAVSDAPGLLDVYASTHRLAHLRGNDEPAVVFEFAGHESAEGVAPEAIHMPPGR
jgi:hypothetical protein